MLSGNALPEETMVILEHKCAGDARFGESLGAGESVSCLRSRFEIDAATHVISGLFFA